MRVVTDPVTVKLKLEFRRYPLFLKVRILKLKVPKVKVKVPKKVHQKVSTSSTDMFKT